MDHEIKIRNNAFLGFDLMIKMSTPDQYYWTNSTSWTNTISTSWSKIQSSEKVEFRSHEIWPPDPESK